MSVLASSLICSTYNSPNFLKLVLDSMLYQSKKDFELIIADDGSGEETKKLINQFSKAAPFPVIHLWHEDQGWRKSQIHNQAIAKASTDHLIFIDGDCILAEDFVKDHQDQFHLHRENYVLMGRRVELGPELTKNLTPHNYREQLLAPLALGLLLSCARGDSRSYGRKFSLRHPILRTLAQADKVDDLLGCNFSLNKKSMVKINGFNDEMERGEDGDIFVRLRNSGHKLIGKKYYAVMFHLFHGRGDYQYVDDFYNELIKRKDYTRCDKGLESYLG